jgi:hypothetical protein
LPKSAAFGVASAQEFEVESGTPFFEYDYPNYKMIYKNANAVEVSLPKDIKELAKEQPNFNATIILQRRDTSIAKPFNALLPNILKVRFGSRNYPVRFFIPHGLKPENCTALHFNLFYDGWFICCNVEGYE